MLNEIEFIKKHKKKLAMMEKSQQTFLPAKIKNQKELEAFIKVKN